ncbi:MAG: hypothetical protein ACI9S8_002048 [Chlamydiales bacterium]
MPRFIFVLLRYGRVVFMGIYFKSVLKLFIFILFLSSCSGGDLPGIDSSRKQNEKGEFLYRESDEFLHRLSPPELRQIEKYPWEGKMVGNFPRITKEFFRCKGSSLNPLRVEVKEDGELVKYEDCNGRHSLPLHDSKEFIYPILHELLNHVQKKTGKRVVVTSGHSCPKHNSYRDPSKYNRTSKHMIGAEVAFYLQGMEGQPEEVVELLRSFYSESSSYKDKGEYQEFSTYDGPIDVLSIPVRNKEVYIKIFNKEEGRDFDNRHPYPYISVQVRHDREEDKGVFYTWNKAYNHYFRY